MAGGGEEAALGGVGALGRFLLALDFTGRLADTGFQHFVAIGQRLGHGRHFAHLAADQQAADAEHRRHQQAERAQFEQPVAPGGEQGVLRNHGQDTQIGKARYRRDRDPEVVATGQAGLGQDVAQPAAKQYILRLCTEYRRLPADIGRAAGGDDLVAGVDQHGLKVIRQPVGPAEFLHVGGLEGGEAGTGKTAVRSEDAPGQRIAVTPGVAADVRSEGCRFQAGFELLEIGAILDVDPRRREIGRDETLVAVAVENDQVA